MTEDEAMTKTCCGPLIIAAAALMAGNLPPPDSADTTRAGNCIASNCMAWRTVVRNRHPRPIDDAHNETVGFCGLAGAPS